MAFLLKSEQQAYAIPMATVLYQLHLAGTMTGVILANLVPTVPFVILVMPPFIEQIDPRLEAVARVFGANTPRVFLHVLSSPVTACRPSAIWRVASASADRWCARRWRASCAR